MIEVKALPSDFWSLVSIDPGALGGWALFSKQPTSGMWLLVACGLARPALGERPRKFCFTNGLCCVGELPQHQKNDSAKRTNDLFKTSLRLGVLAEATGADWLWPRSPHSWKGSVDKKVHNARCVKRLSEYELQILKQATRADGSIVPDSELNNVIDAIGLGLVTLGRW